VVSLLERGVVLHIDQADDAAGAKDCAQPKGGVCMAGVLKLSLIKMKSRVSMGFHFSSSESSSS
jgi:hypothetical protein